MKYTIIQANTPEELIVMVTNAIKNGREPRWGISFPVNQGATWHCQALIRKYPLPKHEDYKSSIFSRKNKDL